ncbi:MAG: ABC transporter ATP-binding protein [Proteobacteria bacterium]|nr:ABC transporter ATP-binding protein [Pseudomonadota bacterium]
MPAAILETRQLSKQYPGTDQPAVNAVSLAVEAGQFFGLLGPNGAGKTTLLSMISGLRRPDSGQILLNGNDVAHNSAEIKRTIGLVPQDLALYQNLTGRENLMFFGSMQGLQGSELQKQVEACLEVGRLQDYAHRRVADYSGGLKRRLNLAIGLLHEPALLILDEPTVGIDPQSRNFIFESLRHLNESGMTIIYTTHYMEEVEQLCREVAIMDQGHIIARGSLDELLTRQKGQTIHIRLAKEADEQTIALLQQLPDIDSVTANQKQLSINSTQALNRVDQTIAILKQQGAEVLSLSVGSMNLEQVFLQLTGTRLRD